MRNLTKEFAKIVAQTLPISEPVYEFGSLQVEEQKNFADLRPLFQGKDYVGCDMMEGSGVDKVLNLHHIDLPDESVGTVLVLDTLEHVEFPHTALKECYRILKPKGIVAIISHMNFPIHNYPFDYWRFTPDGFKSLLQLFPTVFADFAGEETFPHTVVAVGIKEQFASLDSFEQFKRRLGDWKEKWSYSPYRSWKMTLEQFIPPVLVNFFIFWREKWSYAPAKSKWKIILAQFIPPILTNLYQTIKSKLKR